ncbi:uncharacterized protein LOC109418964 [Aedes albopictus]|uniref:Uncharacterized protein n=1 Tax=Aedes albopictus TaxID=7160 RepID=A0ABM2A0B2_AEDAL|nr:uncharacterized protein LOC115255792 [Aedes albopictus]XP_029733585.1 uncharacterized protein LOC109418964 [Aedes albopictus]
MDRFLRFFIKFHGYAIALLSILFALVSVLFTRLNYQYPLEEWYNFRFSGIPMLILGAAWIMASLVLVIGVFKECPKLVYPYGAVFVVELGTLILRDVYLLVAGKDWDEMVFINISVVLLLFIIPYIALSLLALLKLIEVDPIMPKSRSDNFVRFDNTQTNTEA